MKQVGAINIAQDKKSCIVFGMPKEAFEVKDDLPFELQFGSEGKRHRHRVKLVWMQRLKTEGYRFGFQFNVV